MPTIHKPKAVPKIERVSVPFSDGVKRDIGVKALCIADAEMREDVLLKLSSLLSDLHVTAREALETPLRIDLIKVYSEVQSQAEKLYRRIAQLEGPYRQNFPETSPFMEQLADFHFSVAIHVYQLKGRGNPRGGARKQAITNARLTAEHALAAFFDLNAWDVTSQLRSSIVHAADVPKKTKTKFFKDRKSFVEFCIGLVSPE